MTFELHRVLSNDCIVIGSLPLSMLLLMNDCRYPWFILVPQRPMMTEVFQLSASDQQQLWHESALLAKNMQQEYDAHKINLGALGNVVSQLHVHHIARFTDDPAWPAPVWGHSPAIPYEGQQVNEQIARAVHWFGDLLVR